MVRQNQIRTIIRFLTPETDSWRALFRTMRIWLCCGLVYGLLTSVIALSKFPVPWDASILLTLLFVAYAGLKAVFFGAMIWVLFALYAKARARIEQLARKS